LNLNLSESTHKNYDHITCITIPENPVENVQKLEFIREKLIQLGELDSSFLHEQITGESIPPEMISVMESVLRNVNDMPGEFNIDRIFDLVSLLNFCGVPDDISGDIQIKTFGSPGGRWSRGVLNVSISTAGATFDPSLNAITATQTIVNAFLQWQVASNFFMFTMVPPGSGEDIRVSFGGNSLDSRFGAPGGVLAVAAYPPQGTLYFDSAEVWSQNLLLSTALHEIGHLLGLAHSNLPNGTMNPFVSSLPVIDAESINAIRSLYGWSPQQTGPGSTLHRPALGVTLFPSFSGGPSIETALHMVWRGRDDDQTLWWSQFNNGWTPQQQIVAFSSTHGPALAHCNDPSPSPAQTLMLVWKGRSDDQVLYWSRLVNNQWEGQRDVPGASSSAAPALANVNGRLFLAWKGRSSDTAIYWSEFNQATNQWASQQQIRGAGTSDGPALAELDGQLFMFWKGVPGDENIWFSLLDLANPIWKPQRRVEYVDNKASGGISIAIASTQGPSASRRGDAIILAWKGAGDDQTLWTSFFQDGEFSGQIQVPGTSSSIGPSVAQFSGRTFMSWKGRDNDQSIWWTTL
jgi:hypothetical protein